MNGRAMQREPEGGQPPAAEPARPMRWTISKLMLAVLAVAVALGLLRTSEGPLFALWAGCVVGCYLAPLFAHRGMKKLDRDLAGLPPDDSRALRRPTLLAQAYVLILFGWMFAGLVTAAVGMVVARQLAH